MLKVGRKRKRKEKKERKKEQTLTNSIARIRACASRSAAAVGFACLKLHHAAKKAKYKTRSIFEYFIRNNHATHRLKKKHFSHGFKCK